MKKAIKIIAGVVVGFFVLVFMGKGLDTPSSQTSTAKKTSDDTINIATYNIDSKDNPNGAKMAAQFKKYNIDVVGMQEVDVNNDRNDFDMMSIFKGKDYPYHEFSRGRDFANGEFGIGTISNRPFEQGSAVPIDSSGVFATKTLERNVVKVGNKRVAIYNTHLSFESTKLRKRQLFQIMERINADKTPYKVILGDFNADSNVYEFAMFKNNYQVINGQDAFYNTFRLVDPGMKVCTVDNIIVTKNMKVKKTEVVNSDLSDHYMMYSSLQLLDKKPTGVTNNVALGQDVTATSSYEKANQQVMQPAMAVDGSVDTDWESAINAKPDTKEALTMRLDQPYDLTNMKLIWGANKATSYDVQVSKDGNTYDTVAANQTGDTVNINRDDVTYVRLQLNGLDQTDALKLYGYSIKEWQIFGKKAGVAKAVLSDANILSGLPVEAQSNGSVLVQAKGQNVGVQDNGTVDETGHAIINNIPVKPNADYELSFDNQTNSDNTAPFTFDLFPSDADKKVDMSNYANVTDILRQDTKKHHYTYAIHTAENIHYLNMVMNFAGSEKQDGGKIEISNFKLIEKTPINHFEITTAAKHKVGTSVTPNVSIKPAQDASAVTWKSSDESVVAVKDGKLEFKAAGTATITAALKNDTRYKARILMTVEK
ncbi:endonuclease/exonuclease/phosphatase family protein [Lacticaseibacillus daqingensis]|uniref:endonuclease/exonuclease/phosphatase family protein n=1 Tax=Lacticaseibacillus daqingensis TaxID=2486014 RepID=UPI000F7758CE|nr:endonuclease/exonuclease/phosphatase family protein [Lacticaseibacillus daqingensis]